MQSANLMKKRHFLAGFVVGEISRFLVRFLDFGTEAFTYVIVLYGACLCQVVVFFHDHNSPGTSGIMGPCDLSVRFSALGSLPLFSLFFGCFFAVLFLCIWMFPFAD